MNDIKPTTPVPVPAYYIDNREDEISLVDLFVVLYRRKLVILLTLLLCTGLAIAATFIKSEKTTYATTIEIGGDPKIESSTSALTKLQETYIPATLNAIKANETLSALNIEARAPKDSDLIILETQTVADNPDAVNELHSMVAQRFIAEHDKKLNQERVAIQNQIERLRLTLESIKNSGYLTVLRDDVATLRQQYLEAQNISDSVRLSVKDELRFLQTKLIEEEQAATTRSIELQSKINELRYKLDTMPETALISVTLETAKTTGTSPLMIIALGIILGGMLGVFAAFMVEFLSKVKHEKEKQEKDSEA
ncbi:hypothetical protein Tel_08715 [Candidatus Tenderia electrophaga]|jgi:LPS O-antigen subunit length determinant protein (WzzB/FepE family)|uniref:Polysaccharide chain length determinant N-terminal domain-containing protein n=1 Tax=Candidatus Tenderia electrophaga TaxID=1748243 RepID=A0A0S2TDL2_9GAMM|nr:hypothetical protein Tel_08715 [Candidatus Tenderia electrophaga]